MKQSLYSLTEAGIKLKTLIEDETELQEYLDGLDIQLKDKARDILFVMKEYEGYTDSIDKEIKRLQNLKKSYTGNIDRLKNYIEFNMKRGDIEKIETDLVTFALRKTPGKLIVDDKTQIPKEYIIIKEVKSVDTMAIKRALKYRTVEGVHLESDKKLTIK